MSNLAELNDRSANPTGMFGYTPLYSQEKPEYDFQRGGPPTTARSIVASEWEDQGKEYVLLISYDATTRVRSVKVLRWVQSRMRWDDAELPSYLMYPLKKMADGLFYPEVMP